MMYRHDRLADRYTEANDDSLNLYLGIFHKCIIIQTIICSYTKQMILVEAGSCVVRHRQMYKIYILKMYIDIAFFIRYVHPVR